MTTKQEFVEWFNEYKKDRGRDLHKLYDNNLAGILEDFKYEVDCEMFDYYIEGITDIRYGDSEAYTYITWYSKELEHTILITDVECSYEFEEPGEIYDLFEEWNKMCMEVKDKLKQKLFNY